MALNKYMHPRNIYKTKKANFQHLAIKYPEFRKHVFPDVSGKLFLDFKNPESLRQLSITLMKEDFGLDVELPPDRLVPTIPLRLNYILWIEDILKESNITVEIRGIDIGTGGSCVYPLLSTSMYKWKFLATEVDDLNFDYAVKNVKKNNFSDFIQVQKVEESAILLDVIKDSEQTYDFCMCNPPFFSDHLEAQGITNSRSDERPEPNSINTASSTESVAFGGEVEFVKRMIHESMELKSKVRVFTSMVGKKSSLSPLKEELRKNKITNFSTTEFCQGKTMRWGIGWSFDDTVKFPKSEFKEKKKDKRPPLSYLVPEDVPKLMYTTEGVVYQIKEYLKELKIHCDDKKASETKISMIITAYSNTWSHQRRKRRMQKDKSEIKENGNKSNCVPSDTMQDCKKTSHTTVMSENDSYQATASKKRKLSADSDETNETSCSKLLKLDEKCDLNNTDATEIKNELKSTNDTMIKNSVDNDIVPQSSSSSWVTQSDEGCGKDSCLLKCNLSVKQIEEEQIVIEMSWIDGSVREVMNQVLQYFKNKLKSPT